MTRPQTRPQQSSLRGLTRSPFGRSWHEAEPQLEFAGGGRSPDPKTGIALFGPWSDGTSPSLAQIRIGLIGTGETINAAREWIARCRLPVYPEVPASLRDRPERRERDRIDPLFFPHFPGLEQESGFRCQVVVPEGLVEVLSSADIRECVQAGTRDAAVEAIARLVGERLQALREKTNAPHVVIVALPEEFDPFSGAPDKKPFVRPSEPRPTPQLRLFNDEFRRPSDEPTEGRTLHRALKAEAMRAGIPIQVAWPRAFLGGRDVEDDASRAWNFWVGMYFKAGGCPWRLVGLRTDTCYVGLSFFRRAGQPSSLYTSMAQVFSSRGDGLVLRGEPFEDRPARYQEPHLPRTRARDLLTQAIQEYRKHNSQSPPSRLVVHKTSGFSPDEIAGIDEALGDIRYRDLLSIDAGSPLRLYRTGDEAVLRGTAIELTKGQYAFFTSGYVPFLQVYPGFRVPRPLLVRHDCGDSPAQEVLRELLALTKINWNTAAFATRIPITIDFARDVGKILSELPESIRASNLYRFYT